VTARNGQPRSAMSGNPHVGSSGPASAPAVASFARSLVPMVIANDQRRFVAANTAACLLLRLPEEEIVGMTVDDLTPPESRALVGPLWEAFIQEGTQQGTYDLLTPDGATVTVEYSATANIGPGRHLSILMFPPGGVTHRPEARAAEILSAREREVLGLVAMGRSSGEIAEALVVARSTVESHVRRCLEKLGARNRAHAIALALARGEVTLELHREP